MRGSANSTYTHSAVSRGYLKFASRPSSNFLRTCSIIGGVRRIDAMKKERKNFWEGRRVLVTGANGFLAGWGVKDLLSRGAVVAALIYQKNPVSIFETEGLHKLCEVIYSDILDFQSMKRILQNHRIETVFHLGAQAICKVALEDPTA